MNFNAPQPGQFTWAICDECSGSGGTSAYLGAFSTDDLREDPDFAEDYFAGRYDKRCGCCEGTGKVKLPRPGQLSFRQLREIATQQRNEAWKAEARRDRDNEIRACGY